MQASAQLVRLISPADQCYGVLLRQNCSAGKVNQRPAQLAVIGTEAQISVEASPNQFTFSKVCG